MPINHMPKTSDEQRSVTQYKVRTLHTNVVKVLGKKDGEEVTRTDRVPVAVFTDLKALEKYQKDSVKPEGFESYEVVEDWTETEPKASGFGLPFNPAPIAPVETEKGNKAHKDNGTD